jgi:hypothetical protein
MNSVAPVLVTWILFSVLAIPIATVAIKSLFVALEVATQNQLEMERFEHDANANPMELTDVEDAFTFTHMTAVSVSHEFGPFHLTVNPRSWAAFAALLGLILFAIGLLGLLHFPTRPDDPSHVEASRPTSVPNLENGG